MTPEATKRVITREAPGLANTILIESLKIVPTAMLSRAVAGILEKTIIVNLVGSPKGVKESVEFIWRAVPHAVKLLIK